MKAKPRLKPYLLQLLLILSLLTACRSTYQNFDYSQTVSPKEIRSDIKALKKKLEKHHVNLNWEGKKDQIFHQLDLIANSSHTKITLDSFENKLKPIIASIDDGHTQIIHQKKYEERIESFQTTLAASNIHYLRVPNFMNFNALDQMLMKFEKAYSDNPTDNIIIDLRSNPGGVVDYVKYFLTYFIPSSTEVYEKLEIKNTRFIEKMAFIPSKLLYKTGHSRKTGEKKLAADPKIYLLIDKNIASGSMLSSYHLQRHGAYVIGEPPSRLFNTFGMAKGHILPNSKLALNIATSRLYLSKEVPSRTDNMLTPDYIPKQKMNLNEVVSFIERLETK